MPPSKFPDECFQYLSQHTLTGIRVGKNRSQFTSIWVVDVGNSLFARSWSKSLEGWMGELLASQEGQMKFGDLILTCRAVLLSPTDTIHSAIDEAYLKKYTQQENLLYAKGIVEEEYRNYTIEFFPITEN